MSRSRCHALVSARGYARPAVFTHIAFAKDDALPFAFPQDDGLTVVHNI